MYCKSNLHLPLTYTTASNRVHLFQENLFDIKLALHSTLACWAAGQPLSPNQVGPLPDVWDQFPIWKTDNLGGKGHKQGQNYSSLKKWGGCFVCETIDKQDKVNTADSAFIFLIIQSQSWRKSKSMVMLVRAKKMVLCGLVFARRIARMILIQKM